MGEHILEEQKKAIALRSYPREPRADSAFLRTVLAGAASVCAASTTHPIDTVKIRLQIHGEHGAVTEANYRGFMGTVKTIFRNESFRGFYKGLTASWMRESVYSSLRLGLYEPIKHILGETDPRHTPLWIKLAAGSASGILGSALANPTDLIKVRMQAWEREPHSIFWHIQQVWKHHGLRGFYRGVGATTIRAALLNGVKLSTYDHVKHTLLNFGLLQDDIYCHFICSFITGINITLVTAPVDIAKTRLMNQPHTGQRKYSGLLHCFVVLLRHEGPLALYKGFMAQWLRFGPFTTVQLMVWEELRKLCGMRTI